jgi:hypothetical protein
VKPDETLGAPVTIDVGVKPYLRAPPVLLGPFTGVKIGDTTLDYTDVRDFRDVREYRSEDDAIVSQHDAFRVTRSSSTRSSRASASGACHTRRIRRTENPIGSTAGTTGAESTSMIRAGTSSRDRTAAPGRLWSTRIR